MSACSAVSLPSKIDNLVSDDELEDVHDNEYDFNDDDDDDDDGFLAYDDEEYNSDGDERSKSAADLLNGSGEDEVLYDNKYPNGKTSPGRKLGQR